MENTVRKNFRRSDPRIRLLINGQLDKPLKEGVYISDYFLDLFDHFDVWQSLVNWDDEDRRVEFLTELENTVGAKLEEIQGGLIDKIPNRTEIIREIFQLYQANCFSGMVTLVLSQVDGLMKEITKGNEGFYASTPDEAKKVIPNRLKHLDHEIGINYFSELHLLDIGNRNDYMLFQKDIADMTAFNRHSILHGESYQFGTKLNALKSILLLVFIGDLYDNTLNHQN